MSFEIEKYELPAYWASYFVNGDSSGMEAEDIRKADSWWKRTADGWDCVDVSEESWFQHYHDAGGLAGDVAEYTFMRAKEESESDETE